MILCRQKSLQASTRHELVNARNVRPYRPRTPHEVGLLRDIRGIALVHDGPLARAHHPHSLSAIHLPSSEFHTTHFEACFFLFFARTLLRGSLNLLEPIQKDIESAESVVIP